MHNKSLEAPPLVGAPTKALGVSYCSNVLERCASGNAADGGGVCPAHRRAGAGADAL